MEPTRSEDGVLLTPDNPFAPRVDAQGRLHWRLARVCAMSPGQLMLVLCALALPSVVISIAFYAYGAPWVGVFNGLELLVVALAFAVYARGATDDERIQVSEHTVDVEVRCGPTVEHHHFRRAFVRLSLGSGAGQLLVLSESGKRLQLGRHIPAHLRQDLYRVLRSLLPLR